MIFFLFEYPREDELFYDVRPELTHFLLFIAIMSHNRLDSSISWLSGCGNIRGPGGSKSDGWIGCSWPSVDAKYAFCSSPLLGQWEFKRLWLGCRENSMKYPPNPDWLHINYQFVMFKWTNSWFFTSRCYSSEIWINTFTTSPSLGRYKSKP